MSTTMLGLLVRESSGLYIPEKKYRPNIRLSKTPGQRDCDNINQVYIPAMIIVDIALLA